MKRTLLLLAALIGTAQADVRLPAIIADHAVLQRGKPVPIWGWAEAGEEVTVQFAGQTKKAKADKDGAWKVSLDSLKTSAEPAELTVKGKNTLTVKDLLVGEVWLCSGQSNMQWSVSASLNPQQEIAAANYPNIRLFKLANRVSDTPLKDLAPGSFTTWAACDPQTVPNFSAVGYFFGRELFKSLNVPIGLINSSWGGTRSEAWTSKPAIESVPTGKAIVDGWATLLKDYNVEQQKANYEKAAAAMKANIEKIKAENAKPGAVQKPLPNPPRPFEDLRNSNQRPAVIYNAQIAPLGAYAIKGAIWYQGEANQGRAVQYMTILPAMIKDWRKQWNDEFSFYIAQLAGYGNGRSGPQPIGAPDTWAELQWAQLQIALKVPKCGLAVTNDIGEEKDIHPKNKQEVGRRLALQALVKDYKKTDFLPNGIDGGPVFTSGKASGNKFTLSFNNVGGGLKTRGGSELKGFTIAGPDKVWKPAKAKIVGKQVEVWADDVPKPAAVRYAWAAWSPEANLINAEGLPATLFRTDDWELFTAGAENPWAASKPAAPSPATQPPAPAKKEEIRPAIKPDGKPATPQQPAKKAA